ncbi:hypothetical protein [Methylocystis parvus]|uniref:Twin-arginine translocation signal domain-containing protein n=1 Tax=Methylocystis parvus TaxID=134 RepID=A0A6B8M7A2_9HYPH|nr:hypothetical protein [Methylocystis parvus]QGM99964.1 hypothetical protein F7D14_20485 [Methylocystis parvus]WBK02193.1 hypothetical protein MMG94_20330 [Methylocystis parvus OBBP]
MIRDAASRRQVLTLAAAALPATLALPSTPAIAYQGNMERALASLQDAMASLEAATPNKGGHRERAMQIIQRAMNQVQMGIDYANRHGGGGL